MARNPVSVCIITLNEEENLSRCLASVEWADEIVVVDSLSTDRTREIAAEAGARVIEQEFLGYIEQKNFVLGQASHDWVLSVDADEALSPELTASIQQALEAPGTYDAFACNRLNRHMGKWIRRGAWYPDRKVRLCKRAKAKWTGRNPHDSLSVDGRVGRLDGDLLHYTYRDIAAQIRTMNKFTTVAAEQLYGEGVKFRLYQLLLRPPVYFFKSYVWRLGFLDGVTGLFLAVSGAYYVALKYTKLRELHQNARRESTRR